MCNPRRIQVQATRLLAEAWDQEVRRQVTLHGRAVGRAAVRENLAATVGRPVLACLDRVLARLDGWRETQDGYRHDVAGGYVVYHSDTGELEIVAERTSDVEGEGEAATTVSAEVTEELAAAGSGRWYEDNWGGFTEERARQSAEAEAQRALDLAAADRIAAARERADTDAGLEIQTQAEQRAQAALDRAMAERGEQLASAAAQELAAVGARARAAFNPVLAEAYRDAILAFARSRHAEGVRTTSDGNVLTIQFEVEG
jgi:hypothetical protein